MAVLPDFCRTFLTVLPKKWLGPLGKGESRIRISLEFSILGSFSERGSVGALRFAFSHVTFVFVLSYWWLYLTMDYQYEVYELWKFAFAELLARLRRYISCPV